MPFSWPAQNTSHSTFSPGVVDAVVVFVVVVGSPVVVVEALFVVVVVGALLVVVESLQHWSSVHVDAGIQGWSLLLHARVPSQGT